MFKLFLFPAIYLFIYLVIWGLSQSYNSFIMYFFKLQEIDKVYILVPGILILIFNKTLSENINFIFSSLQCNYNRGLGVQLFYFIFHVIRFKINNFIKNRNFFIRKSYIYFFKKILVNLIYDRVLSHVPKVIFYFEI